MRRIAVVGLAFSCALFCLFAASAQEKRAGRLPGWGTAVDPDHDSQIKLSQGKLTITVPKTYHDLTYTEDVTKLNAPRILQDTKGDFRLQVTVKAFPLPEPNTSSSGQASFVSAGLLVWQDDKNFIRMDRAAEGGIQGPFIWIERFQDGKAVTQKRHDLANKDTYLRITRKGDQLRFESSEDGKQWNEIQTEEVKLPQQVKAGVLAINTTNRAFSADLEQLRPKAK